MGYALFLVIAFVMLIVERLVAISRSHPRHEDTSGA